MIRTRSARHRFFLQMILAALPLMFLLLPVAGVWADAESATPAKQTADKAHAPDVAPSILAATERQSQVSTMVTKLAERAHYSKIPVNDALSALLLEEYIESLDGNRHYFLAPDIMYFNRYKAQLDDALHNGDVQPAFDVFRLYRLRVQQYLTYAISLLEGPSPDFDVEESYTFDRQELPWIENEDAMHDLWRRRVKSDALSLMLTDKTWKEASEVLVKRYKQVLRSVNSIDGDDVFETFMNAFARTLDPHSSYLSPRQSEEYRIQMSLSYQGIGASLQLEDEYVKVMGVIPGGPAAIDGRLKANDRIIGVGQDASGEIVDVVGWMLDEVVDLIRGPADTTVRLHILPADALPGEGDYTLPLLRNKIKLEEQAAQSSTLEIQRGDKTVKVGVITVPGFYQDFDARSRGDKEYVSTTRDVDALIAALEEEKIDGLVLDLRGNGGGHLSEATAMSGLFIDRGPVVQLRDTNERIEILQDPIPSSRYTGPLVVLVDRFSASASEIFAAAIQDYHRGIIIGQQTFGKGTVQNLYLLDQFSRRPPEESLGQLTLTIGKYYRVTGDSTQNRGVMPDITLPSVLDSVTIGENTRPRALPWDQITSARFRAAAPLDTAIATINTSQETRESADPDFKFLLEDIEAVEVARKQKAISLRLETRREEQAERKAARLDRENERRGAQGIDRLETLDDEKPADVPDVLLRQAAEVAVDLATIESSDDALLTRTGT